MPEKKKDKQKRNASQQQTGSHYGQHDSQYSGEQQSGSQNPWQSFWQNMVPPHFGQTGWGSQNPWQSFWQNMAPPHPEQTEWGSQNPWQNFWQNMASLHPGQTGWGGQNPWQGFWQNMASLHPGQTGGGGQNPWQSFWQNITPPHLGQTGGSSQNPFGHFWQNMLNLNPELSNFNAPFFGPHDQNNSQQNDLSSVVELKPSGSKQPFFCVAPVVGSVAMYTDLASGMEAEQPVYGLQPRGLDGKESPIETIEELASFYISEIRSIQSEGPYSLVGYTFGGWVAFEIAQQLLKAGEAIDLLAIIEIGTPPAMQNPTFFKQIDAYLKILEDYQKLVFSSYYSDEARVSQNDSQTMKQHPFFTPLFHVAAANYRAMFRYIPRPFPEQIDLFITSDQQAVLQAFPAMNWSKLSVKEIEIHPVGGNALTMFQPPHLQDLIEKLTLCLN